MRLCIHKASWTQNEHILKLAFLQMRLKGKMKILTEEELKRILKNEARTKQEKLKILPKINPWKNKKAVKKPWYFFQNERRVNNEKLKILPPD